MLNPERESLPQTSITRFQTLPDVARQLKALSTRIGAEHFALFMIVADGPANRLVPCLDSDYPGVDERTRELAPALGSDFAERMSAGPLPVWWDGAVGEDAADTPLARSLGRCIWAERIAAAPAGLAGLAFPVSADRGQRGVAVMTGRDISLTMPLLADVHAQLFALFALVEKLWPSEPRPRRAISRREIECLRLTAGGQTSEEIAAKLGLSVHTANQYLTNSTAKLNAVNRMHAVAKAIRLGLID